MHREPRVLADLGIPVAPARRAAAGLGVDPSRPARETPHMSPAAQVNVTTAEGLHGTIDTTQWPLDGTRPAVLVRLADGRALMTPVDALARQPDGSYRLTIGGTDLRHLEHALESAGGRRVVVPVVEEQLRLGKQAVETGRVRVKKRVVEEQQTFEQPLNKEEVVVERVTVERFVDGPVADRQEGDTLVLPVLEEVLVVEKRLMVREEVRITRKVREVHQSREVTLRREEVEIERVDGKDGELGTVGTGVA
jgi:uncharacterized protein (TIGR02271 family)